MDNGITGAHIINSVTVTILYPEYVMASGITGIYISGTVYISNTCPFITQDNGSQETCTALETSHKNIESNRG